MVIQHSYMLLLPYNWAIRNRVALKFMLSLVSRGSKLLNYTILGRIYWLYLGESFLLLSSDEIINLYLLFSALPCTQTYLLVTHNKVTETKAFPFTALQQFCVVRDRDRVGDDKRWYTLWDIHKMYLIRDKHTCN